jgi:hypothetical protein
VDANLRDKLIVSLFDTYSGSRNLYEDVYCAIYLSQTLVAAVEGSKTRVQISSIYRMWASDRREL